MNRRAFLRFLAAGAVSALAPRRGAAATISVFESFTPIRPSREDTLVVPAGFRWNPVMLWGERMRGDDRFGYNADFTAFLPLATETEGLLWVNHEFVSLRIPSSANAGTWEDPGRRDAGRPRHRARRSWPAQGSALASGRSSSRSRTRASDSASAASAA